MIVTFPYETNSSKARSDSFTVIVLSRVERTESATSLLVHQVTMAIVRVHHSGTGLSRRTGVCFCCLLVLLALAPSISAETSNALPTKIVVGVEKNVLPLEGLEEGRLTGYSSEVLGRLLANSNMAIEPRVYPSRRSILQAACKGEIDLVLDAFIGSETTRCLVYSTAYLERTAVMIAREDDHRALDPDFLAQGTIIVVRDSLWDDDLRKAYPGVRLLEVDSISQGLTALNAGKGDVYIGGDARLAYELPRMQLQLRVVRRLNLGESVFRFAAPVKQSGLIHELDRRLAQLPAAELDDLRIRWLHGVSGQMPSRIQLTPTQQDQLLAIGTLKYAVAHQEWPLAMQDASGNLSGAAADYMTLLERSLGLRLIYVPTANPTQAKAALANGSVDLLIGSLPPEEAPQDAVSVGPLTKVPMVIVTQTAAPYVGRLSNLSGKRVAVVATDPMLAATRDHLPGTHLELVGNLQEGLEKVANNEADALIGNLPTLDGQLRLRDDLRLRIAGSAGFRQPFELWMPNRLRPFDVVLAKGIQAITPLERDQILRRWSVAYRFDTPWAVVMQRYWPQLSAAALLLGLICISYWRLREQVHRRKRTEARLERELSLREALLACQPEPMAAKDSQRRYVAMNQAFEQFFGVEKDHYLGHDTRVLTQPDASIKALTQLQEEAIASMQARHLLLPLQDAHGRMRSMLAWAVPYRERSNELGGVLTMYLDVTDIQEARQKAEIAERRLNDITSSLPALVFQIQHRHRGQHRWSLAYLDGDSRNLFGIEPQELLNRNPPLDDLLERGDWQRLFHAIIRAEADLTPVDMDVRLTDANRPRWVHVHAKPRSEMDRTMWSGVVLDATDRRLQAQALQEAKDAAEVALRAKETFLAVMSHEIRTPMHGVLGLMELLQNSSLDAEQQRMLSLALESGQALAQILNDILDYAKVKAGRLAIAPEPLDLRELFDGVMSLLLHQAHQKHLRMVLYVDAQVPALVEVDSIRLRQILFNLLGNAIKFTEIGSIALEVRFDANAQSGTLVVSIRDSGIGISPNDLQNLFAPFVQVEHSSRQHFGGTGLGLVISRHLAELMGGELSMESQEGLGTKVTLRLPCKVLQERYEIPSLKGRALVIDTQHPCDLSALSQLARATGMRVQEVRDESTELCLVDAERTSGDTPAQILISPAPLQAGLVVNAGRLYLSTNPLLWTAFLAAVETALGVREDNLPQAKRHLARDIPDGCSHPMRILVAEDHPINREVIRRQLVQLGYDCTLAENGEQALRLLEEGDFQILLTDFHMPNMDGFELTRAVRAHPRKAISHLPVIGVTATTVREELVRGIEAGMSIYVLKPTSLASLDKAVQEAAEDARELDEALDTLATGSSRSMTHESPSLPNEGELHSLETQLHDLIIDESTRLTFHQALSSDRATLIDVLKAADRIELRQWCHRASGAISLFGWRPFDEAMQRFHQQAIDASLEEVKASSASIFQHYDQLLSILGNYHVHSDTDQGPSDSRPFNS